MNIFCTDDPHLGPVHTDGQHRSASKSALTPALMLAMTLENGSDIHSQASTLASTLTLNVNSTRINVGIPSVNDDPRCEHGLYRPDFV